MTIPSGRTTSTRVAVVGGSIGGMTAAGLLRDAGYQVDVYERSPGPLSGLGTGIVVQPELVRFLLERTTTTLEDISVPSSSMRYVDASSGALIGATDDSWRFTSYNALYHRLLENFGLERYHFSCNLERLVDHGDQVDLTFSSGETAQADLVVLADGGASAGRRQLLGITPEYAGYVTWRGLAELDALSASTRAFFDDTFTYGLLDDGHLIAYPIPVVDADGHTRRALNYQWYWNVPAGPELDELMTDRNGVRRPTSVHHHDLRPELLAEFHSRASERLTNTFVELLHAAEEPFVTVIADADVPQMRVGRCVLIGDAAVTPRPHAAAGGAKAAADAWALVAALTDGGDDLDEALNRWEAQQLPVGRAYLQKVRRMADVLQHGGSFTPGDPANRFGLPTVVAG
ncbi:NAD(P)-binding protein [Klenkia terrae]|uniref:NAD(P)-binding protein n=1 Tax=Klenkia terrae TaxID=1052259 RepID=A0ABU8E6E3_9ACTN|nr:NAD(P)-binding protein [Klenkia terrae]SSC24045.1 FAD/NAD(P)-binding domain superfamily protein [Klenkia terrae]